MGDRLQNNWKKFPSPGHLFWGWTGSRDCGMPTCTGNLTDKQLLERFASQRDEEGFTQLVQRHGPMVLGVCRQILRQEQDAEDAFQATFLVLSRKAGSIRSGEA